MEGMHAGEHLNDYFNFCYCSDFFLILAPESDI
jgi:hypothetical protein